MLPKRRSVGVGAFFFVVASAGLGAFARQTPGPEVDFGRDVLPVLARCTDCHGAEKANAGLRLDSAAAVMTGSRFGTAPVVIPGEPDESPLLERVTHTDPDERMPPEGSPLSDREVDTLRRWIAQGAHATLEEDAELARHWAYEPRQPVDVPTSSVTGTAEPARNAIDHFVRARLAEAGLEPSAPADRSTLIRRATLDLTGLPPTPTEVREFLEDREPGAWGRVIDRLLDSPHYAEERARRWLDLARYADSDGYEKDGRRTAWRWRDWVIDAFERDLSFDRFTIEQLAGDLLPDATLDTRIATGFHRNTMTNLEGGVDPEEFRTAAVIDRVNTTAAIWLGTTLACAQCHDHKFDPFSQREYFELYAFFNSTADDGRSNEPRIPAPTAVQRSSAPALEAERATLLERLANGTPETERELADLIERARAENRSWTVAEPQRAEGSNGTRLARLNDGSLLAFGELPATDTYELQCKTGSEPIAAIRIEVLTDPSLPDSGPGRPTHRNFVLNEVRGRWVGPAGEREVQFESAAADFEQRSSGPWPAVGTIDGDPKTGWAIAGGVGEAHQLVLTLAEANAPRTDEVLVLSLDQSYGGGHLIGRLRVSTSSTRPAEPPLPPAFEQRAQKREPTEEELAELRAWHLEYTPLLASTRARLAEVDSAMTAPTAMVFAELPEPRPTFILERGSHLSPGEPVERAVPAILHAWPNAAPTDRLGFAHWLVQADNPLTARVLVNRFWSELFGAGLVTTLEDFGTQGEAPTHPALLDWLASDWIAQGWSTKQLLRTIVDSATYRQSSQVRPAQLELDPKNRLLSRGPRHRLDAETVRDVALAASGLLSLDPERDIGGPSVFPPQPEGTWAMTYSGDRWATSEGPNRWRRGLYTFWRRTAPYPTFQLFDAPSRELSCTNRPRTNTPLQALALLNDPVFVEAARALGHRLVQEFESDEERLIEGFRRCTAREPEAEERALLLELARDERARLEGDLEAALALAHGPPEVVDESTIDLATWTFLASILLNLDETVTKS